MSRSFEWKNKKMGLVLSGGGAKGAYQIGMFRALEELGLTDQICVISGTSIGALNGMAYASGGVAGVRSMMFGFGEQMAVVKKQTSHEQIAVSREAVSRGAVTVEQFAENPDFSEYDAGVLAAFLQKLLPDEALQAYSRSMYACAYSLNRCRPEYFHLNGRKPQEQRDLILASASLPFVFPPVKYQESYFLDGGVVPQVCGAHAEHADKIPLKPVLLESVDAILVNFLNPADQIDTSGVPEQMAYMEIRPSHPLEKYPGEGTLDFSEGRMKEHEALGYRDTMEVFQ